MLYVNVENESKLMKNSVIKHNLIVTVDLLIKHCLKNNVEDSTKYWYNHQKDQINTMVELLVEELKLIKKFKIELTHLKQDIKTETKELINSMRRTAVIKYNRIVNEIVFMFPEYFEYIKH